MLKVNNLRRSIYANPDWEIQRQIDKYEIRNGANLLFYIQNNIMKHIYSDYVFIHLSVVSKLLLTYIKWVKV